MSGAVFFLAVLPPFIWWWRPEIVNLASDCIAEGIRKANTPPAKTAKEG